MNIQVNPAVRTAASLGEGIETDAFIAPSGACFNYSGSRTLSVTGHPTAIDQVLFIRHLANRQAGGVRVLGIRIGGTK